MAKPLKVSDEEVAAIEKMFGKGLSQAAKNPKKFWDMVRDRQDKTKPFKGFKKKRK